MLTETYNCNFFLSGFIGFDTFILISIILTAIFSYIFLKRYRGFMLGDIGFILVLVGGLMNLSEWLIKGCVRDYLNFFNLFHFNIYDIMVTVGLLLVSITIWKKN